MVLKNKKNKIMKKKKIDKDYFYDLVFRIKLTPSKWSIIPWFKYRGVDDVSLFIFDWLFFSIELQRWEEMSFNDLVKAQEE